MAHDPEQVYDILQSAVYGQLTTRAGCFVTNQACESLTALGPSILPSLEQFIIREVMPDCPDDEAERTKKFPGLAYLLVCYFELAKATELLRAKHFLESVHGPVLVESIRAIVQTWNYQFPYVFLLRMQQLLRAGNESEKKVVSWALEHQSERAKEPQSGIF